MIFGKPPTSITTRQLSHPPYTLLRRRQVLQVDELVGTEHRGDLESLTHPVDDDDARRASLARHGNRVQPQAAGALDHHGFADPQARDVPATRYLGHGAIDAHYQLVGEPVGHLQNDVVRVQIKVVAERAFEVRPDLA